MSDATASTTSPMPNYTAAEIAVDKAIHIVGLTLAAIGLPWLLITKFETASTAVFISLPLYAIGLVTMLTCSLLYNSAMKPEQRDFLRRFDHAGILIMIAGTYSPFTLVNMGGPLGVGLFVTLWSLAMAGAVLAFALPRLAERLMVVLALVMGWSTLVAVKPLFDSVPTTVFILIAGGGLLYTAGVGFFLWEKLRYHNAIWHAFVVLAAAVHYVAVMMAI